jgi:hypothetical protein
MSKQVATTPKPGAVQTQPSPNTGLVAQFAGRYNIEADKMLETLKQTAFRQRAKAGSSQPAPVVSNEQLMALLVIAQEYGLNPFTREIYAFPSEGGIVPIIGFDGWVRMINKRPELDYMEIREAPPETSQEDYYVEVEIKRKDRSRATIIREYLKECYRKTDPWDEMPRRMTRHKAIIQCGRIAFGYAGVFDPDDAERVYANAIDVTPREPSGKPVTQAPQRRVAAPPIESAGWITLDQANTLADKIKEEGVELTRVLGQFSIGTLEQIQQEDYEKALDLIDKLSKEGATT